MLNTNKNIHCIPSTHCIECKCDPCVCYLSTNVYAIIILHLKIKVITKLPNSEQSYKGKVKTHNYINRQNQSTTGKL